MEIKQGKGLKYCTLLWTDENGDESYKELPVGSKQDIIDTLGTTNDNYCLELYAPSSFKYSAESLEDDELYFIDEEYKEVMLVMEETKPIYDMFNTATHDTLEDICRRVADGYEFTRYKILNDGSSVLIYVIKDDGYEDFYTDIHRSVLLTKYKYMIG